MAPRERAHAEAGPSTLARALRCPGSVSFIADLDEEQTAAGQIADEGTILHSFAEDCLNNSTDPFSLVGHKRTYNGYTYELTEDDAEGIQQGLDVIDDIPGKLFVEKRIDLGRWMPGQFGTLDIGVVGKKLITVADWKFGYEPVSPVENEQLMAYALGLWDNFAQHITSATRFRLIIFQPRSPKGGGEWEVDLDTLLKYGERLTALSKQIKDPDAPRVAGEKQCKYCPGAKTLKCSAYDKFNLDMIVRDFDEMDDEIEVGLPMRLTPASLLTPDRRSHLIRNAGMIKKYLERLEAMALDEAVNGIPVPGFKAVYGQEPRKKWIDEVEAEEALLDILPRGQVYKRKVITPAQAKNLLSETEYKLVAEHINKGKRSPTLVPIEDARPAIVTEFNDDEDEDE